MGPFSRWNNCRPCRRSTEELDEGNAFAATRTDRLFRQSAQSAKTLHSRLSERFLLSPVLPEALRQLGQDTLPLADFHLAGSNLGVTAAAVF